MTLLLAGIALLSFAAAVVLGLALQPADALTVRAQALARREGPIVPLLSNAVDPTRLRRERHICIDTTAAGGNAELLAGRGS